jgi:hypothetical protein
MKRSNATPSTRPALVADPTRFGLVLSVNNGTLAREAASIPSLVQKGPDFRFDRVDADLDESHSRVEARS